MLREEKESKSGIISFAALIFVLIPLEMACATFSYYWAGAIGSVLLMFAVTLNLIPILFYWNKHQVAGIVSALFLASLLVPESLKTGSQLFFLQREASSVVTYVYETRLKTGKYPKDLSDYSFLVPNLQKNIEYSVDERDTFRVAYLTTGSNTLFWYRPEDGWNYYDD